MSNLVRPVGPLPPRVYWIRRVVVLAVALVVVILTATIVAKIAGGGSASGADGPVADPKPSPTDAAASGLPADCSEGDLDLNLAADRSSFSSEQNPRFTVELKNRGEAPCLIDANAQTLAVDVISGKDQIWSSDFCVEAKSELLLLDPKDVHSVAIDWDRGRNDAKCSKNNGEAKPGTYRASARIGDAVSKELVFTLG